MFLHDQITTNEFITMYIPRCALCYDWRLMTLCILKSVVLTFNLLCSFQLLDPRKKSTNNNELLRCQIEGIRTEMPRHFCWLENLFLKFFTENNRCTKSCSFFRRNTQWIAYTVKAVRSCSAIIWLVPLENVTKRSISQAMLRASSLPLLLYFFL